MAAAAVVWSCLRNWGADTDTSKENAHDVNALHDLTMEVPKSGCSRGRALAHRTP